MALVEIGKIVKSQGLRGCLKVASYLESGEILGSLGEAFLKTEEGGLKRFRVEQALRRGERFFLLKLEGVGDRDSASVLVGREVLASARHLQSLPEGEYYWRDLIGLQVLTEEGEPLGTIRAVFPTGSNDVYVCRGGEREILLPAIPEVVRKVDIQKGLMTVRLLKGL
jgi:16S rRNA processing protein RimM